jgi:hypothetical protein
LTIRTICGGSISTVGAVNTNIISSTYICGAICILGCYITWDTDANSKICVTGFGVGVTIFSSFAFGCEARAHWVGSLSWISSLADEITVTHSSNSISSAITANLIHQVHVTNVVFTRGITA